MSADILLQHLSNVKRTGRDHGVASCPTANHHNGDRHPSLNWCIRDDGALLIHCKAGCSAFEITSAVGLSMSDLFPPRTSSQSKPDRRPFPATDLLRCIASESRLVYLCGQAIHKGDSLTDADLARLLVAVSRINGALTAGGLSQ